MSTETYGNFDFLSEPGAAMLGNVPPSAFSAGRIPDPEPGIDPAAFDPPEDSQARVERVRAARNPLLEVAQPLLRMLADMPASLDSLAAVTGLRQLIAREVTVFGSVCDKASLPWTHLAAVRYALCTALDEAASRTQWGRGIWAEHGLLVAFEGEADGGEKFFLLIGRMAADPDEYIDVLEVMYHILSLGFEGRYSVVPDGHRHLEQIRQRLRSLVGDARGTTHAELSPHWRGEAPGKMRILKSLPVWATAGTAALIVFALFAWYKYLLLSHGEAVEAGILAIGQIDPVRIPIAHERLRLSSLLKDEIASGAVAVDEGERGSMIVFRGDDMFRPGQSAPRPALEPILRKIAQKIERVKGRVVVTGHSDNQPIQTREFPNNRVLSERRAALVADILKSHGVSADRVTSIGKGDAQAVANNATADGRARNRRVEIFVEE
ncbi:type VI secretion system protein TssL, long form [Burkholderia pyrrocinia]|uniref:type VI secretion system protein TssL, long form n=1 Tax=Burkholderia TaxID=32008 RepID=UPI0015884FBF|nr:type VI secretion system protein TssL, long form [Burkholderia cenocepacia]EKS9886961.1 type VI secretion system protein TssL, long form [Burkholderia pyrrocinia]EKS9895916.1 type VI secretion system protein TssL, long form [Burkholderia pyrrocinia]EKS9908589.1 type VI secretion system protein TssL, long form [Burkholderia pyrrocinia]